MRERLKSSRLWRLFSTCQPTKSFLWLYPAVVLYFEFLFRSSTTGWVFQWNLVCLTLFSVGFGTLLALLASLFRKPKVNRILTIVFLSLLPVIFLVEFFIFKAFRVFYAPITVIVGTGDAVGGFMDVILKLIFSWNGLSRIFLFFLPLLLYVLWLRRLDAAKAAGVKCRCILVAVFLITYILGLCSLRVDSFFWEAYGDQYNFAGAVEQFGLSTGIRLDIRNGIFKTGKPVEFETTYQLTPATPVELPTVNEEVVEPVVPPGDNVLNLDFNALAQNDDGRYAELDAYVSGLEPSCKNAYTGLFEGKNLIFITVEAFCQEVIDPELTPTLYRMATKGFNFLDYSQPSGAGTTGGEYLNIFGMLPTNGGESFKDTAGRTNYLTMGYLLNERGYYGRAYHNNDYTFYSRHLTHINLGYSDGFLGVGNGLEEVLTPQWPSSDLEMFQGTVPTYIDKEHFNVYYMTVSGHCNYHRGDNVCTKKNWDRVENLNYPGIIKGYFASQLELEDSMTYLLGVLEEKDLMDDTVIVIAADHFPYGLDADSESGMPMMCQLYGRSMKSSLDWDRNRLIIWSGCLEEREPVMITTPTCSMDILPTLLNLFGIEFDSRLLPGRDVFSDAPALVFDMFYNWKTELGSYAKGVFTPASPDTVVPEGYEDNVKAIVRNKVNYCDAVLDTDYFEHIFGEH